ncbi:hypothetical protein [Demequina sp. NBRC 110057]|uniref:hypothetical protein n=1 Tax=Demequina sp. NBRC 110057 TaxID=1570346 RepID=UPI0009FFAE60|nr:hypothetical protein [Demequina sp. NBRC 110057]
MTHHDLPPEAPAGAPQPLPAKPRANTMGRIALGLAIAGFVFACIPGALIVGWVLLPVGFILGIVGATRRGQRKGAAVAAIITSVIGTIVGVVVFLAVTVNAVDEAFDEAAGGDTTVVSSEAPSSAASGDEADDAAASGPEGTRDDPYPFGSVVANDDWTVELTAFDADADAEVAAASDVNDAPGDGFRWITVDAAATYTGADTGNVLELSIDYVTADGTVVSPHDEFVMGIEPEFDTLAELYEGGSEDGRVAMLVPDSLDGELRVTLGLFADDVFLALPDAS